MSVLIEKIEYNLFYTHFDSILIIFNESVSRVYHTGRINALTIPDKHFFSH